MEGLVFCAGNPLLDISAEVEKEFLDKYGLKPANAILAEPQHLPLYEELVNNYSVEYIAGGAGQNTIRSLQWMRQVPGLTTYVGSVGTDKYGELLEAQATKDGVRVLYQKSGEHPTGTCAALIHQRERSLVANLAAANHYKKDHFETEEVQAWINKAKFFYCSSFFLTVSPETVVEIGKHAHANDKHLTINLAAPFLIDFFFDQLSSVMPYADIIVGNEHEGLTIGRKLGWGEDLKVIAEKLGTYEKKSERPRIAIITQGDKETIVYHEGQIKEFPPSTIPTEEIVDLNGAGDCFIGGFLSAFTQGKSIDECIAAGHYCAGVIIKRSGITFPDAPNFSFSSH